MRCYAVSEMDDLMSEKEGSGGQHDVQNKTKKRKLSWKEKVWVAK